MTEHPLLYADFNNADALGRLRLSCNGTVRDLAGQGIVLRDGLQLRLHDEELEADGLVCFSAEENAWVAVIDWQKIQPYHAGKTKPGKPLRIAIPWPRQDSLVSSTKASLFVINKLRINNLVWRSRLLHDVVAKKHVKKGSH